MPRQQIKRKHIMLCSKHAWSRTFLKRRLRISTAECRPLAQMMKQLRWMENMRRRNPDYVAIFQPLPNRGVTSVDRYMPSLKYILKHCDGLLAFGCVKGLRKWRFKTYIYTWSQSAPFLLQEDKKME